MQALKAITFTKLRILVPVSKKMIVKDEITIILIVQITGRNERLGSVTPSDFLSSCLTCIRPVRYNRVNRDF